MNKKIKKYYPLILLLFIPFVWIFFFKSPKENSSKKFSVTDVSDINNITITKKNKRIDISKKEKSDKWFINGKYEANNSSLKKLFQALSETRISKYVSKNKSDSIYNFIKNSERKITVLNKANDTLLDISIADFKVGFDGTYGLFDNDKTPYIISIPGLENNLNKRYNLHPLYWINPEIFKYQPHEIKEVKILYSNKSKTSYRIEINTDKPKIFSYEKQEFLKDININKVGSYLTYFMNVKFSDFNILNLDKSDSLKTLEPDYTILVKDIYDISKKVELFKIKISENPKKYDLNKIYAIINDEDIVVVKYFDIDLILKDISYFTR